MEVLINNLIVSILKANMDLVEIALIQRAKFEGWLKFELVNRLRKMYDDSRVEFAVDDVGFVDIMSNNCLIELKTPNTSYIVAGCEKHTRPVTMNINSIIHDIGKLRKQSQMSGYIAFVLFPLDDKRQYEELVNKIEETGKKADKDADKDTDNDADKNVDFKPVRKIVNINLSIKNLSVNVLVYTAYVKRDFCKILYWNKMNSVGNLANIGKIRLGYQCING